MIKVVKDKVLICGPWLLGGVLLGSVALWIQPPDKTRHLETEIDYLKERMTLMRDRVDHLDGVVQEIKAGGAYTNRASR
jgi:hypothetical protein